MLPPDDNELLTRVGPGTPMGALQRHYWQPVLLSSELPKPDGPPLRVRLLGEDLVAFRNTSGQVGLLAANCSHRGAPLCYGRNEEDGLRCVYHGWKYDVHGQCMDMPNEPPESNFKDKVHHTAYPCTERGGVIWTYMGELDPPPPLPGFEWLDLPEEQRCMSKRLQYCNWVQALEGEIDQSHVSFAHRRLDGSSNANATRKVDAYRTADTHPRFEVLDTNYGVVIGAGRQAEEGSSYWRITQFLMPFWSMTGPYGANPTRHTRGWMAMDDHTTMMFSVTFHPLRPLTEEERERMRAGGGAGYVGEANFLPPTSEPGGAWRPKGRRENDYFWSQELQQTKFYSGFPEFWAQDAAVQEGMGPVYERSREHLGTSDLGIIRVRQRLLQAAKVLRDSGTTPPAAGEPELYRVRGAAVLLPNGVSWFEASDEQRRVIAGVNQAGV
ncbi:MAG TPA: Rieske 2Fe-2S domain-containing protein [Chloroflexota bacterium]|nr:Rieske 2Fe-2S domain-containing protein [Chloroflexota bacterium]